jgi:rhomboid protease GluP
MTSEQRPPPAEPRDPSRDPDDAERDAHRAASAAPPPDAADDLAARAAAAAPARYAGAEDELRFHRLLAARGRPRVRNALIAINVVLYGLMVATGVDALKPHGGELLRWGADYGPLTFGGEPWRLLSNTFVHFGILHIGLNMYVLWQAGEFVERLFGSRNFAALYLVAALGGSLASVLIHPFTISAGASGAVFGVYGALGGYLLRQRGIIPAAVLARLRGSALTFIAINLAMGFTIPQIDNSAHIGGLLAGALCGWTLAAPLDRSPMRLGAPLALLAAAAIATAVLALRAPPVDYLAVLRGFAAVEAGAIERYRALLSGAPVGDVEAVRVLEQEILPPWQGAEDRLRGLRGLPDELQRQVDRLGEYANARSAGWRLLVVALRSGKKEDLERAKTALRRADALIVALKKDSES